jgi:hypothetical protein
MTAAPKPRYDPEVYRAIRQHNVCEEADRLLDAAAVLLTMAETCRSLAREIGGESEGIRRRLKPLASRKTS